MPRIAPKTLPTYTQVMGAFARDQLEGNTKATDELVDDHGLICYRDDASLFEQIINFLFNR